MKSTIILFALAAAMFGCNDSERTHLQSKVDSLNYVLIESHKAEVALNEVGVQLDSIDVSRHALHVSIVEGITYADYIGRLKTINNYIKDSEAKLLALEVKLKDSKGVSSATIRRLKTDLESRSKEIVTLQMEVVNLREENRNLASNIKMKDSIISSNVEIIKMARADVSSLEALVQDINDRNRVKVAGLYFAQAHALETAADRTKFAPRKKKETRREALELYKLSFSLGNVEAEAKIHELEKKLS